MGANNKEYHEKFREGSFHPLWNFFFQSREKMINANGFTEAVKKINADEFIEAMKIINTNGFTEATKMERK